jgi:hypothetical protein
MSVASFKVRGKLDSAGPEVEGTLFIDRKTGKVTVRRKGSRTTYETTVGMLATWVCRYTMGIRPKDAKQETE